MAEASMRILPEEMRGVASELGRLGGDADQVQGHLQRSWGRLDAGWQSYAKGNVEEHYHQATEELRRMAAMLEQMGRAVHQTTDLIEEADQAAVGFFGDSEVAGGAGPGGPALVPGATMGAYPLYSASLLGGMIAPVASEDGDGLGELLERIWNWLNGRGWKTNAELEAETSPPEEEEPKEGDPEEGTPITPGEEEPEPPEEVQGEEMYVDSPGGLNMRSEADIPDDDDPDGQDNIIQVLPNGAEVELVPGVEPVEADGYTWRKVNYYGQEGWVAVDYLGDTVPEGVIPDAPLAGAWQSGYGYGTTHDVSAGTVHPGVDIHSSDDTLRANADGRVYYYQTYTNDQGVTVTEPYDPSAPQSDGSLAWFGNYAVLETEVDGETYYQVFAHMDGFDPNVTQGQEVTAGTPIGTMGDSGMSDGAHVHWEIRREDAMSTNDNGNFELWYPTNEDLDANFVDPNEFSEMLEEEETTTE